MSVAPRAATAIMPSLVAFALAASVTCWAARTRADAVPPGYTPPRCTPSRCPRGTHPFGQVGHGVCGEGCVLPRECGDPERCDPGSECSDTRYCVVPRFVQGRVVADTVFGECGADGSCARGECVVARRCTSVRAPTPPTAVATPRPTTSAWGPGCGACAAAAPPAGGMTGAAWLAALAGGGALGARLVRARRWSRR